MTKLYTYVVTHDTGAAPNPFGGYCTLTICKPKIRKNAKVGNWVAGFGSANAPSGDLRGKLVYAMRVSEILTMQEYDRLAFERWPGKRPNKNCAIRRSGDCIYYDFSEDLTDAKQRPSVHNPSDKTKDLDGKHALISNYFFYFGSKAINIPAELKEIIPKGRAVRSHKNDPYVVDFETWIENHKVDGHKLIPGQLYGWPDKVATWCSPGCKGGCNT